LGIVSLTLTPVAPWHAAQTVLTFALPASMSAACENGVSTRRHDIPSTIFMELSLCDRRPLAKALPEGAEQRTTEDYSTCVRAKSPFRATVSPIPAQSG